MEQRLEVHRYAWYRISEVMTKGNVQTLSFPSVRAHHAGQYFCVASNRVGPQTSLVTSLTVLYPSKNTPILARPSSVVDAGGTLTLTCSSQTYLAVDHFTWHRLAPDRVSVQC
uniref:Si:ch211-1f22.4 n=1 Tax=Nothobranchius kadleci TaxID=1051664 RepID=A0A1A8DIN0_NOTKA